MQNAQMTTEQKKALENFLKGYALNRKLLRLERYEKEYFGFDAAEIPDGDILNEAPLARARMFEVRHFILGLANSDEKLLLYYHYVKCESIEKCAELLGISRRSGFRMKNRALDMAYKKLSSDKVLRKRVFGGLYDAAGE